MSDARLRELERRFALSGALDDEAAVIGERLRVGAITSHALGVASDDLYYPAARIVSGKDLQVEPALSARTLESALHVIPFTDGDGGVHPLGVLGAAVLADEAGHILRTYEPTTRRIRRLIESAGNILPRMRGSRKRVIHPLDNEDVDLANIVRLDWCGGAINDLSGTIVLSALMVFTVQYVQSRESDLAVIIACFTRRSAICGYSQELRRRWFHSAMLHALMPHLVGHSSTIPHPPHLSDMLPQHRTPER